MTERPEWLADPATMVFAGDETLAVGAIEQHGLGEALGNMFTRPTADVSRDWEQRVDQIRSLLTRVRLDAGAYELDEVTFELGFSAEGVVVFVAKAGIRTTIRLTFKRRKVPSDETPD